MTDTNAPQAPTTEVTLQGGPIVGFGVAEMRYLLSVLEPRAGERARSMLRIDVPPNAQELAAAGASSLFARDMATLDDTGNVALRDAAAMLVNALSSATQWTEIGLLNPEGIDSAIYVQGEDATALLQPRGLGTWYVMYTLPSGRDEAVLQALVEANAAVHPEGTAYLGPTTGDHRETLFIRRQNALWTIARLASPDAPPQFENVDEEGLRAALKRLVALPAR